jgi:hypothetical protein
MNTWKIEMVLSSGKEITGCYIGDEDDSNKVANVLFSGPLNEILGILSEDGLKNILVRRSEIAAMIISIGV